MLSRLVATLACAAIGCATSDDGGASDAAPVDGGDPVACAADYREAFDATNDAQSGGIPEPSNARIAPGGAPISLCGAARPGGDVDFYRVRIEDAPMDLRVALGTDAGARARVDLWTGNGLRVGGGAHQGEGALYIGRALPEGEYLVSVTETAPAASADALYRVELSEAAPPCALTTGAATYVEAADGPGDRDNDVVSITQGPATFALTGAVDAAEPTALTATAEQPHAVTGVGAALESDGDDYRDRDTFAVGAGASELALRLSWPHPPPPMTATSVDRDLYVFYDGDISGDITESRATATVTERDELVTIAVDPARDLWFTVAAFSSTELVDLPVDYRIDVCPTTFVAPVPRSLP